MSGEDRPRDRHDILLATANARYVHASLGLRCLFANLGELRECAAIREFTLDHAPSEIAERLIEERPRVVGLGAYIWNVRQIAETARILKSVAPEIVLVAGGPEISHEYEGTALFCAVDYIIRGEGEEAFAALVLDLLDGRKPVGKVIQNSPPDLTRLRSPYEFYTDEDLAHRLLYVESSRGCPFRCEFCLSALDEKVREFPLDPFLVEMARLIERGGRRFKFVDRTFNLASERVDAVLRFLLERWRDGMEVHFEIVPDRLSESTLERMAQFPERGLRLEAGVQSLDAGVLEAISRRQDIERTLDTIRRLRERTGAILHADLVAGLPGETWASFRDGFDRLLAAGPQEIQVGILKRLKGAPIRRHFEARAMVFSQEPPYEILQTDTMPFVELQRIKRFARYFELYHNSGNFPQSLPLLFRRVPSAFDAFMAFSDELWEETGKTHRIALARQAELLYRHLVAVSATPASAIAASVEADFRRLPGRKDRLDL